MGRPTGTQDRLVRGRCQPGAVSIAEILRRQAGVSAAWWHGFWPELPATVELAVPLDRQLAAQPGIVVRRRCLAEADLVELRRVRVTSAPLTVLEASVSLGDR